MCEITNVRMGKGLQGSVFTHRKTPPLNKRRLVKADKGCQYSRLKAEHAFVAACVDVGDVDMQTKYNRDTVSQAGEYTYHPWTPAIRNTRVIARLHPFSPSEMPCTRMSTVSKRNRLPLRSTRMPKTGCRTGSRARSCSTGTSNATTPSWWTCSAASVHDGRFEWELLPGSQTKVSVTNKHGNRRLRLHRPTSPPWHPRSCTE